MVETVQTQPNMYFDSVKQWNVIVGCKFNCKYCQKSFQAQMKRQKWNCDFCYHFEPHFHADRLADPLPITHGDEFIWACSSSDIYFAQKPWMGAILECIRDLPERQFFVQTKAPIAFNHYQWPDNVMRGITLETNRDAGYELISRAPKPTERFYTTYMQLQARVDVVTIEPVLDFDLDKFVKMIEMIAPKRVYIGYDTKKCQLPEPPLAKVDALIEELRHFTTVKPKLLREAWNL